MATNAMVGLRTTLVFNGNSIGEIQSVSGTRTRNVAEVLSCNSTNQAMEVIAASLNEGEVSFSCVYDQTAGGVYNDLNTDFIAGTSATATISYIDPAAATSTHAGTAIITSLDMPSFGSPDDPIIVNITLRFSGQCTYTDVA